jgi:hypothetical protein
MSDFKTIFRSPNSHALLVAEESAGWSHRPDAEMSETKAWG